MADSCDGLVVLHKVPHNLKHARVQSEIFRRSTTRQDQSIIFGRINIVKGRVERKVVPALLGIGLVALKVMDGCRHTIASALVRTDCMDRVANSLECLEGNHHLRVFSVVSDNHENLFAGHRPLPFLQAPGT